MRLWMILGLWLVYLALTANLELSNLVVGLLVALALTWLAHPDARQANLRQLPAALWAGLRYAWVVTIEVFKGAVQVARFVLHPDLPIQPGIVAIPSGTDAELATALSAHAITLSPGEMVVEIGEDGVMYTHALDASKAALYAEDAQRLRRDLLQKILP